ncbi:unnamed protein product [Sphagnum balticum]
MKALRSSLCVDETLRRPPHPISVLDAIYKLNGEPAKRVHLDAFEDLIIPAEDVLQRIYCLALEMLMSSVFISSDPSLGLDDSNNQAISGDNLSDDSDDDSDNIDGGNILEESTAPARPLVIANAMIDLWKKTPLQTRLYISASLFFTSISFLLNKNRWPDWLNLEWKAVVTRLQVWRPVTAFLFFGPLTFNYFLTLHFVWTYMAQLEKLNYKSPESFTVLILFGATSLLLLYPVLGISSKYLGHNLSTYLVYIWARLFEGTDVSVMDLFTLKAEMLPW